MCFDDVCERYITARYGTSIEFDVDGEEKYADLPLLYYYGYTAEILDGEGSLTPVRIDGEGENNVCRVYLSKVGKGTVRVWYKPTSMQNLSLVVTAGSLVACAGVFGIYYSRKKQKGFNDGNAI